MCCVVWVQSVVEDAKLKYTWWKFYYTDVPRQRSLGAAISEYESSLGLGPSSENALVNLRIAVSCDFFVGTMGSTFSVIIDDLRRTSGKEPGGMLTVNRDRAWMSQDEKLKLKLHT